MLNGGTDSRARAAFAVVRLFRHNSAGGGTFGYSSDSLGNNNVVRVLRWVPCQTPPALLARAMLIDCQTRLPDPCKLVFWSRFAASRELAARADLCVKGGRRQRSAAHSLPHLNMSPHNSGDARVPQPSLRRHTASAATELRARARSCQHKLMSCDMHPARHAP